MDSFVSWKLSTKFWVCAVKKEDLKFWVCAVLYSEVIKLYFVLFLQTDIFHLHRFTVLRASCVMFYLLFQISDFLKGGKLKWIYSMEYKRI